MKRILLLAVLFSFAYTAMQAQEAKRYILLEHFTNTVCGICSSKNPPFFNTIEQYQDIHHIAYHPPVPYTSCLLYQHNTTENASRANYYNIFGTPKVFLNGTATGPGALITTSALDTNLGLTSPIGISVDETLDTDRQVTVSIKTFGTAPTGNLKLYVSVLEATVDYNSPNGESVHHNVFRKFLANGTDFTPAADGEAVVQNFTYTIDSDWQAGQIYVMAYLQDDDTKEIINSGNRFDEALPTSSKDLLAETLDFQVSPNPASNQLLIDLSTASNATGQLRLQDAQGRTVWSNQSRQDMIQVDVSNFPSGLYFLSLQNGDFQQVEKVIIQ